MCDSSKKSILILLLLLCTLSLLCSRATAFLCTSKWTRKSLQRTVRAAAKSSSDGPAAPVLDEILYRRNLFTKEELKIIQDDIMGASKNKNNNNNYLGKLQPESTSSVARGRRGISLPADSPTVQVFRQGSLWQWIQNVVTTTTTDNLQFQLRHQDVPMEIRSYEQAGAGMAWHSDDVLFAPYPQLEVVWTLENSSDCQTLYKTTTKDAGGDDETIQTLQTEVNSVLLIPAGGPEHCVTSLQRGRRIILKAVYAVDGCEYLQDARVQQFNTKAAAGSSSQASKRRKGRRR